MWPDRRLIDLFKIEHPIVLAPMAGAIDFEIAAAVAEGGGLASLPFAMLNAEQAREQIANFRARSRKPVNVNFFCHTPPQLNNAREARWRERAEALLRGARHRSLRADSDQHAHAVRRGLLRDGRGDEARSGQLPFRTAAGGSVQAGEGRSAA